MRDDAIDAVSDGEATDEPDDVQPRQNLSCRDCKATGFPNLSKLNKHRNTHNLPYGCVAEGCDKRFAQKQALDRHTQIKHGDTNYPTKYYHCTVDGCKYASTGVWKKRFARVDQVKAHVKDYGHYGPHSANERPRRPDKALYNGAPITAVFEELTLGPDGEESGKLQTRKSIQSCEFDPRKAKLKLWHEDSTGDLYLHGESLAENLAREGSRYPCMVPDCYYQEVPPVGLGTTLFKTHKSLMEHCRRAHEPSSKMASTSHSLSQDDMESSSSYFATDLADMSTWSPAIDIDYETTFSETSENPYQAELASWSFSDQQSCPLEKIDAQHLVPWQDVTPDPLPLQNMFSSSNRSDSWVSMSYSICDDNAASTESPLRIGTSLSKNQPTKPSTGRLKCELSSCNVTFQRRRDMLRHMNSVHRQSTLHTCSICKRQFRRKDKVRDHLQNVHRIPRDLESMQIGTLILNEAESGGGDVNPGDTMMKDGMEGAIGQFRVM